MDEWKLLESLRMHPGMWMPPQPTYSTMVALLIGYDTATAGGLLGGFKEFVELRHGSTSSLHWSTVALEVGSGREEELSDRQQREKLLDLIEEFLATTRGTWGQRMLFREWLKMADPDPALLRYSRSPAPDTVSVEDAEGLLGVGRRDVFALIRDGQLKAGLEGDEVRIVRQQLHQMSSES